MESLAATNIAIIYVRLKMTLYVKYDLLWRWDKLRASFFSILGPRIWVVLPECGRIPLTIPYTIGEDFLHATGPSLTVDNSLGSDQGLKLLA